MNEDIIKQIDDNMKIINSKYESFTDETGWIISPLFTFPIVGNLLEEIEKDYTDKDYTYKDCADENLYRYFTSNDNMNCLFKSIKKSNHSAKLKFDSLIDEVIEAYKMGLYKIALPSLVSIIEGVLSEEKKINAQYKKDLSEYCIEKSKKYNETDVEYLVFKSLSKYIENFYKYIDFSKPRPRLINRHFIQHGRDDTNLWREVDAINLFCVLDGILFALQQHE